MSKKMDPELLRLQRELLAAAEEDGLSQYDDFDEAQEALPEDEEEEALPGITDRYGRGQPKRFDDDDFFDVGLDEGEAILRRDYRRAKRKSFWKGLGLGIVAALELAAIIAIVLWVMSWAL